MSAKGKRQKQYSRVSENLQPERGLTKTDLKMWTKGQIAEKKKVLYTRKQMVSKEQVEQDQGGAHAEAVQGRTRYMRRGLTEQKIRKLKL